MSPATTVTTTVSPAPPTTATYPITALYLFPMVYPGSLPANAPPYDPTQPEQNWFDQGIQTILGIEPSLASETKTYGAFIAPTPNAEPVYASFTVTFARAAYCNMPNAAQVAPGGQYANVPLLAGIQPTPARALLPTESVVPSPMPGASIWYVGNTANGYAAPGSPAPVDPAESRILAGVNAILTALGKPNV